jgi:hypothetical protein
MNAVSRGFKDSSKRPNKCIGATAEIDGGREDGREDQRLGISHDDIAAISSSSTESLPSKEEAVVPHHVWEGNNWKERCDVRCHY